MYENISSRFSTTRFLSSGRREREERERERERERRAEEREAMVESSVAILG